MNEQQKPDYKRFSGLLTAVFFGAFLLILLDRLRRQNQPSPSPPSPPPIQVELKSPPTPQATPAPLLDLSKLANSILSALGAAIITAIFYIAGWVYETHWHTYYGINISQIELTSSRVVIQGIPGVLFFAASIFAAFLLIALSKNYFLGENFKSNDTIYAVVLAYFIAFASLAIIVFHYRQIIPTNMLENQIALIPTLATFFIVGQIAINFFLDTLIVLGRAISEWTEVKSQEIQQELRQGRSIISIFISHTLTARNEIIKLTIESFHRSFFAELGKLIQENWLLGWTISLVFLFLLSIASSAWLGEFDARRGVRTLDGNWQLSSVILFSDDVIKPLHTPQPTTAAVTTPEPTPSSYQYGPLGLVASNESVFFLVDWQDWTGEQRFSRPPNLYQIPRDTDVQLFKPAPTQTPTPTATSTQSAASTPPNTSTP